MGRQVDQLDAAAVQECIGVDEKRVGPFARKRCERCIDLTAGAGLERPEYAAPWRGPPAPRRAT